MYAKVIRWRQFFSRWFSNTEKFDSAQNPLGLFFFFFFLTRRRSSTAAIRSEKSLSPPLIMARANRQSRASRLFMAMATTLDWVQGFFVRWGTGLSSSRPGSPRTSACGRGQALFSQPPCWRPSLGHLNGGGERPRIPPHNSFKWGFTVPVFIPTDGINQEFISTLLFCFIFPPAVFIFIF